MTDGIYHPIGKVRSWNKTERGMLIHAATTTGLSCDLEITIHSPRVVRLRMLPFGLAEARLPSVVGPPAPVKEPLILDHPDHLVLQAEQIQVMVEKNPWHMQFLTDRGDCLCRENPEDVDVWQRWKVEPLGFHADGAGPARAIRASFAIAPDECFYGFGEKYTALNKRGQRLEMWAENTKTIGSELAYKNVPFFMSTAGYGMFVNSTGRVLFEMGSRSTNSYTVNVPDPILDLFVIAGPSFKDILTEFTAMTGRVPLPPPWTFGLWMSRASYSSRDQVETVAGRLRASGIPCDVINLDPGWLKEGAWCDFVWDEEAFPDPAAMIARLRENGFRLCLWELPYVPKGTRMYREGEERGYFLKKNDGSVYTLIKAAAFEHRPLGIVDFSNVEAVGWYKTKHKPLVDMGVSAFKTDFGEAVPEDSIFANGLTGKEMHNLYPLLYNRAVYEAVTADGSRDGVVWGRSGCAGSQRYPLSWGGDPSTTFADLANSIRGCLSYGLSGGAFWACDIGGFYGPKPSPELYLRWAQFGLLCSHARCHGITPREPWEYGEEALRIFRDYVRLRYRLLPYIHHYAQEAANTGLPVVRPLVLEYQDDPNVYHLDLEYLLGAELLVAPLYNESGSRHVYLPEGEWVDYWSKQSSHGGRNIKATWPLERLPLFVRQDSIIPLAPVHEYADGHSWQPLTLDAYLSDRAELTLNLAGKKSFFRAERLEGGFRADFSGDINVCAFIFNQATPPAHDGAVTVDGEILQPLDGTTFAAGGGEGWHYDREVEALAVKLENRTTAVVTVK